MFWKLFSETIKIVSLLFLSAKLYHLQTLVSEKVKTFNS